MELLKQYIKCGIIKHQLLKQVLIMFNIQIHILVLEIPEDQVMDHLQYKI